jgi:predicted polyphosphate/ATP-dependent NAD kinase
MVEYRRIGLIVNPIAGIGGALAAHGSDSFADMADAIRQGGIAVAEDRAIRALNALKRHTGAFRLTAAAGSMGAYAAARCGIAAEVLNYPVPSSTSSDDTRAAAKAMAAADIEIIVFAGGDGTARDIYDAVDDRVALIGIPTGVKMHSAVFALSPEAAGETAARALNGNFDVRLAEIMDGDEAKRAAGRPAARLFGYARTPSFPRLFQAAKAARPDGGEAGIEALGRRLAREVDKDTLVILGPGTTTTAIKHAFGIEGSLLGADALRSGPCLATDANSTTLEQLAREASKTMILLGVIGGQGFVLGRGNQQISPHLLRICGTDAIHIVSTREKLLALPRTELHVDTDDAAVNLALTGYRRVLTGPGEWMAMRIRTVA